MRCYCLAFCATYWLAIALSPVTAKQRFGHFGVHALGKLGMSENFVVLDSYADAATIAGVMILGLEKPFFWRVQNVLLQAF